LIAGTIACLSACDHGDAPLALAPPEVLVIRATTRDVPVYREWVGSLDGSENAQIRARVTGHVVKRDYQEGALVKKGDALFELDPLPFAAAFDEAKSQLAQAHAVQLASQAESDRNKTLYNRKVISDKEYINTTQLNFSNVAKIDSLKANLEQARLNLNFCHVTSPVEGIAGIAQVQVGDLVGGANNSVLASVSTINPIKILFPISEVEFLAASQRILDVVSQPFNERPESIELILADGTTFPHKARLLAVDRQVRSSTGTILVTALLPNPGNVLRPGFFARARIVAQVLKDAVVVPQRAVNEVQGSYQLGIIGTNGKAETRPVQVGPRIGTDWVITSGLQAGEKVVVEGLQKLKAGAEVTERPWIAMTSSSAASDSGSEPK
jgi:membrane fusion protein (multidrug efflux system)